MKFQFLGNDYDDKGNERVKTFFKKLSKWITEANLASKGNWHKILSQRYGQYLVEVSSNNTILENLCQDCEGSCDTCFNKENKGVTPMSNLDKQISEAFGSYEKPQIREEPNYEAVYRITKDGKLEQTEHSKLNERIFWQEQTEETIEESGNLSLDERILAAFN